MHSNYFPTSFAIYNFICLDLIILVYVSITGLLVLIVWWQYSLYFYFWLFILPPRGCWEVNIFFWLFNNCFRKSMTLMIQRDISLLYCHFLREGHRLLRLWLLIISYLVLHSLESAQHSVGVYLRLCTWSLFYLKEQLSFYLFDAETNKRICFLNISPDEVIRSLFFNKNNDSLITVSVYASDSFSSLKCRTTPIEYVISCYSSHILLEILQVF